MWKTIKKIIKVALLSIITLLIVFSAYTQVVYEVSIYNARKECIELSKYHRKKYTPVVIYFYSLLSDNLTMKIDRYCGKIITDDCNSNDIMNGFRMTYISHVYLTKDSKKEIMSKNNVHFE